VGREGWEGRVGRATGHKQPTSTDSHKHPQTPSNTATNHKPATTTKCNMQPRRQRQPQQQWQPQLTRVTTPRLFPSPDSLSFELNSSGLGRRNAQLCHKCCPLKPKRSGAPQVSAWLPYSSEGLYSLLPFYAVSECLQAVPASSTVTVVVLAHNCDPLSWLWICLWLKKSIGGGR